MDDKSLTYKKLSIDDIKNIATTHYGLQSIIVKEEVSYEDQNFIIDIVDNGGSTYLAKYNMKIIQFTNKKMGKI